MKIISLNTFGGHVFGPLMAFIEGMKGDTDIFCFQEITHSPDPSAPLDSHGSRINLLEEISKVLQDFEVYFAAVHDHFDAVTLVDEEVHYGLATFIRKDLTVEKRRDFFIARGFNTFVPNDYGTLGSNAQMFRVRKGAVVVTVCNVHGTSEPAHKLDSDERLAQSRKILDIVLPEPGEKIVMGDFNLFPNTESIRMFERNGFRNLIRDNGIQTTRGTMLRKLHPHYANGPYGFQDFADYTFVMPGIKIQRFEVPDAPVSDHLPMILRIENPNLE